MFASVMHLEALQIMYSVYCSSALTIFSMCPTALLQVKCWQIRRQTKAPQAAGAIHTDFERGFICAEVVFPLYFLLFVWLYCL